MTVRSSLVGLSACVLLGCAVDGSAGDPPAARQNGAVSAPGRQEAYDLSRPLEGLGSPHKRDAEFRRGVSLGMFVASDKDSVRLPLYAQFLDEIAALGATDIELVVEWSQASVSAIEITPHPIRATDDELLSWVMDEAQKRGLRVLLMPLLDVAEHGTGSWRGALAPSDWERWWWSYERFVMHYARIAETHHATLFAVGSELSSTEHDAAHWRALIKSVRKRFHGQLTYAATSDHFTSVSFWDDVDVVGISGYQQLSPKNKPSEQDLARGFAQFAQRLRGWAAKEGRRYLFTEIGYPAQRHAPGRPGEDSQGSPADLAMQLACQRAFYKVFEGDDRLAGSYLWNWFGAGGASDPSYTTRGKSAAKVIEHWFKSSSMQPAAATFH